MDSGIESMDDSTAGQLQWSRTDYTLRDFIALRKETLPVIVRVAEGYSGCDGDDAHDIAKGSIFFVYAIDIQPRVVSRTEDDRYLSMAKTCPVYFRVVLNDGSLSRACPLGDIIRRERNSLGDLRIRMAAPEEGGLGPGDAGFSDIQGSLRVLDVYNEKYLLGHSLCGETFSTTEVVSIPSYLPLTIDVAHGIRSRARTEFKEFLNEISSTASQFQEEYARQPKNAGEIVVFSDPPNGDYEYIEPSIHMSRLSSFKVFDNKKSLTQSKASSESVMAWEAEIGASLPRLPPRKLSGGWMSMESLAHPNLDLKTVNPARRPLPPVPDETGRGNSIFEDSDGNSNARTVGVCCTSGEKSSSSKKTFFSFKKDSNRCNELPVKTNRGLDFRSSSPLIPVQLNCPCKGESLLSSEKEQLTSSGLKAKSIRERDSRVSEVPVPEEGSQSLPEDASREPEVLRRITGIRRQNKLKNSGQKSTPDPDLNCQTKPEVVNPSVTWSSSWNFSAIPKDSEKVKLVSISEKPKPAVPKKPFSRLTISKVKATKRGNSPQNLEEKRLNDSGVSSMDSLSSGLAQRTVTLPLLPLPPLNLSIDEDEPLYDEINSPVIQRFSDSEQSSETPLDMLDQSCESDGIIIRQIVLDRKCKTPPAIVAPNIQGILKVTRSKCHLKQFDQSDSDNDEDTETSYEEISLSYRLASVAPKISPLEVADQWSTSSSNSDSLRSNPNRGGKTPISSKPYADMGRNPTDASVGLQEEGESTRGTPSLPEANPSWNSLDDIPGNISTFTVEQVSTCLNVLNLGQYVRTFREQQIDGALLSCLDKEVLMSDFGFRKFDAIKLAKFARDGWRPKVDQKDTTC